MTRVADSIETKVKKLNEENRPDLPNPLTAQYYLSHLVTPDEIVVQAEEIDFVKALEELIPSVSATELAHYSKVREKFEKVEDDDNTKEENAQGAAAAAAAVETEIERALLEAKQKEEDQVKTAMKNRKRKGKQRAE
jgi:peroxin-6